MEPINYRDALRRRWPVAVVAALVGAIIGGLFPVHVPFPPPHDEYQASSLVGVTPGSSKGANSIGADISVTQIVFFAANRQVMANAAKAAHIKGKVTSLQKDLTISSSKKKRKKGSAPPGSLGITMKQPTAKRSADLTNAFVTALNDYINHQLAAQHQKALRAAQQRVSNLESALNDIDSQIAALLPTPTTTTTVPPKSTTTTVPPTTSTTVKKAAAVFGAPHGVSAILVASRSNPDLADLQAQATVLTSQYQSALGAVASLKNTSPPASGFTVLEPAMASQAKKITAKTSLLNHHTTRAGLGLLGGGILGIGLIFLLDAFDKRLRSVNRTQETLGFPVVSEIPAATRSGRARRGSSDLPPQAPIFATFTAPASAIAEAYRMLRTAVLLGPMAGPSTARGPGHLPGMATEPADPEPVDPAHRERRVVLVVSAGVEPTRALVVTNLAAAFAEAGEDALVVTTGDLRQRHQLPDTLVVGSVDGELTVGTVAAATRPTDAPGVRSLALSRLINGPGQLATRAPSILAVARDIADVVIIDAPLLAVHDAEALVPAVDLVLVVVETGWTRVDQSTRSGAFLRRISAPVLGAVLTEVRFGRKDLRRVAEGPDRTDAEEEDRLVGSSRMARHGRRRRRDSEWAEA